MNKQAMEELIHNSQYLVGREITVNFTNGLGNVTRTATCIVLNETSSIGIGEDKGELNYSVNIWVQEKETNKRHSIPLKSIVNAYPQT